MKEYELSDVDLEGVVGGKSRSRSAAKPSADYAAPGAASPLEFASSAPAAPTGGCSGGRCSTRSA